MSGVTFYNNEVKNSVNGKSKPKYSPEIVRTNLILSAGIRIKATEGDTGSITSVTYQQITLQSISKYVVVATITFFFFFPFTKSNKLTRC